MRYYITAGLLIFSLLHVSYGETIRAANHTTDDNLIQLNENQLDQAIHNSSLDRATQTCPWGKQLNVQLRTCDCITGWTPVPSGQCCSPNSKWDSKNGCSCITGTTWNSQTCAGKTPTNCPSGTSPTADGRCVCKVGYGPGVSGTCTPCIPPQASSTDLDNTLKAFLSIGASSPFDGYAALFAFTLSNVINKSLCVWTTGFRIRNINSNGCLNIKGDYPFDFGDIIQYSCNDVNGVCTHWYFEQVGSGPFFQIRSCQTQGISSTENLCLSAYGSGYTNARLRSRDNNDNRCSTSNVDTQFLLLPKGNDIFLLYHKGSGQCFGLASDGFLRTKTCNFDDSSQWMSIYSVKQKNNVQAKSVVCGSIV